MSNYSLTGDTQISRIHSQTKGEQILVTTPLDMPDCYLSQSISHAERTNQAILFLGILTCILIGILSIGVILMLLMNRMITVPVSHLQSRMKRISEGDFSRDPSIEWNHELGDIGRGINDLSENVSHLMERRLEDEKQKQDLEYRFWELSNGGKIQYVKYPIDYNITAIKTLVRRAMDMGFYEGVNLSLAYCDDCGHQELEMDVCPKCGSRNLTKIERMNGYLSYSRVHGDTRLNDAKMAEIAERKSM